eukprot:4891769-Pyramimonas_sp.AAC.1
MENLPPARQPSSPVLAPRCKRGDSAARSRGLNLDSKMCPLGAGDSHGGGAGNNVGRGDSDDDTHDNGNDDGCDDDDDAGHDDAEPYYLKAAASAADPKWSTYV